MKILFWTLILATLVSGYFLWFIPAPLPQPAPQSRELAIDKDFQRSAKVTASIKPNVIGDWLAALSKGTPLVTTGLAVWTAVSSRKKKKPGHAAKRRP